MTSELYRACRKAVHVIATDGRILKAGRATLFILAEIGYPGWLIHPLTWPPLIWLVEWGYRLVAQNRPFFSKFLFTHE